MPTLRHKFPLPPDGANGLAGAGSTPGRMTTPGLSTKYLPMSPSAPSLLLLAALLAQGCQKSNPSDSSRAEQAVPLAPPDQTYVVRGIVKRVDRSRQEIVIQHEAIPTFVNASGKQVGMAAMAMPFALGPNAAAATIAEGDEVEFTFEVRWQSEPMSLVTQLTKLPPDTQLDLD